MTTVRHRETPQNAPQGEVSHNILLVEDDPLLSKALSNALQKQHGCQVQWVPSLKEAELALAGGRSQFFLAIIDLKLPDASNGQIVDLLHRSGLPYIAITGAFDNDLRDLVMKRGAVDYVFKGNANTLSYLLDLVGRMRKNQKVKALVVDDSVIQREVLMRYLGMQNIRAAIAGDGAQALAMIREQPDISLVITDHEMPIMNGVTLTQEARKIRDKDDLIIIGLSGTGTKSLSAQFLKSGANDFILKPYSYEEMLCRVNQNLDMLDLIQTNRDAAVRDFLTGAHNRRHFFEQGPLLVRAAKVAGQSIQVAMFDIDHFKRINDTWGHDNGDVALKHFARLLKAHFSRHFAARLGGEEFALLLVDHTEAQALSMLEDFRSELATTELLLNQGERIKIACSIGVARAQGAESTLDELLQQADHCLYQAKQSGRNRVVATWQMAVPE